MAKIAVFCSSSQDVAPAFMAEAETFGRELAANGHTLVFGGAGLGMMGRLASGALMSGGEVIGIVPEVDVLLEVVQPGLTRKVMTRTMAERKQIMLSEADAAIALPGGLGTLDEIFDALVLKVTSQWVKPFWLYNCFDFWTPMLEMLALMDEQRMVHVPLDQLVTVTDKRDEIWRGCKGLGRAL